MSDKLFQQYYARLSKEGWLKSLLWGGVIGFSALFVSSFIIWLIDPGFFWIGLIIWGVVTLATIPLFYFLKYRPNKRGTARRIDELGLEERMLTMTQYENDDSFIAKKQREDAVSALASVSAKLIKFAIPLSLIICTSVMAFFGLGMGTVTILSDMDIIPDGSAIVDDVLPDPPPEYVAASYLVMGGGYIDGGDPEQLILKGTDADPVMVVAEDGWVFLCWSDGYTEPSRADRALMEDLEVTAILMELMEIPGMGQGQGQGEPGNGMPEDGQPGESDENTDNPGQPGGASGHYEPSNQIIDGTIYYRESERYEECYQEAIEILENQGVLASGEELPAELREVLDAYFKVIE